MEWNVLYYNSNTKKIEPYNIFNHINFGISVVQAYIDIVDDERYSDEEKYEIFKETIDTELSYYFMTKAEYEILVTDIFAKDCKKAVKVDIYQQVHNNLDAFVDYLLANEIELTRLGLDILSNRIKNAVNTLTE